MATASPKPFIRNEAAASRTTSIDEDTPISLSTRSLFLFQKSPLRKQSTVPSQSTCELIKGPLGLILLHEPSEPRIDFIFVHGLGGGSRKTWSFSPEEAMFWPKEWLPTEVGFEHVRIHSFGYNSDWTTRKESLLTVHDFGQALIADIYNSPHLHKNGETPIVFVAHSMGGLVVKKAYLLALHSPVYNAMSQRIHTIYFLGTPHRGADSAQFTKLLRYVAGNGTKSFIDDLVPGNRTIDQLNDEFRHVYNKVQIWSFFESIPMSFGLVVEKESAVLGLPGEHVRYMEADHRHLCKFDSPDSPNYIVLYNSFLSTIGQLGEHNLHQLTKLHRSQMKQVSCFLRVDQRPESVLLALNEKQHRGSCQWLTNNDIFQAWVNGHVNVKFGDASGSPESSIGHCPRILWLSGRPGTGKSVASTHVIKYLESRKLDCSFYFFRHNDQSGANVASLLRSLAFQMAELNPQARQAIMRMVEDDVVIDEDDHYTLMSRLFANGIFGIQFWTPHFWVIDAVDECAEESLSLFISMISKLDQTVPLRIFITSRPGGQLQKLFKHEGTRFFDLSTGLSGSLNDIETFIRARCPQLEDNQTRESFVSEILLKSKGSFLWASLTMARLEDSYSFEDMREALRGIPSKMSALYSRITKSLKDSPSYELVKCILDWVICAQRPLLMTELSEAVKLDVGRTLTASPAQLESFTGHLLFVDRESRVQVTHETTSAFLLEQGEGLWIDRQAAHARISKVCLTTLCGSDFTPPTSRQFAPETTKNISPFATYAIASFSFHFTHGTLSRDTLALLDKFLRSNVLTWIENIARLGDVSILQEANHRLNGYLAAQTNDPQHDNIEIDNLAAWVTDIDRIIATFQSCLLASPRAIHFLVPYLCPPTSIVNQLFSKPSTRFRIKGLAEKGWGDRLTCYLFSEHPTAVACSDRLLAIGLFDGQVMIYQNTEFNSFEPVSTVSHGTRVRQVAFDPRASVLASCSARRLALWDVHLVDGPSFPCIWSQSLDFLPCEVAFNPDGEFIVLAHARLKALVRCSRQDGSRETLSLIQDSDSDSSDGEMDSMSKVGLTAWSMKLGSTQKIAALVYGSSKLELWNLEANEKIGNLQRQWKKNTHAAVRGVILKHIHGADLLAVSYDDGDVVTYNPWTLEKVEERHFHTAFDNLSATSDGRVLVGAADDGSIHLLLFESLQSLYRIPPFEGDAYEPSRGLTFSADNLKLFDLRVKCCNIWTPSVLLSECYGHNKRLDTTSRSKSSPSRHDLSGTMIPLHASDLAPPANIKRILAPKGPVFFLGRMDGTIEAYEAGTGDLVKRFQPLHHSRFGTHWAVPCNWNNSKKLLLSIGWKGQCIVISPLDHSQQGSSVISSIHCRRRYREGASPFWQGIISPDGTRVLLAYESTAELIATNYPQSEIGNSDRTDSDEGTDDENETDDDCELDKGVEIQKAEVGAFWGTDPSDASRLLAIEGGVVHLFDWHSLRRLSDPIDLGIPEGLRANLRGKQSWITHPKSQYYVLNTNSQGNGTTNCFAVLDTSRLANGTQHSTAFRYRAFSDIEILRVVGILRSTIYFLDTKQWICSISVKNLEETTAHNYSRHFFIPPTWHTGDNIPVIGIISKSLMTIAVGSQLVWVHGFMEYDEKVPLIPV
ncbi:hypothetical protein B0T21DRAFT_364791 [Apiosordaria backusii]|uniref:GPI inositol-deacylase n=1 Tax=Apiosordaria backusii TaxID=314023 RepID=A0AA40BN32_9PEZI|nr:hypothetical protein B0T21DRAFT_364791 [Apiosordaria backusii]